MPKVNKQGDNLYWFFSTSDHGEDDGFSDSLLEYFQGDHEKFIAREAIQNAVDARKSKDDPVIVVFEKLNIRVTELPDSVAFQSKLQKCLDFVVGQEKAEKFFKDAILIVQKELIPVLKISDFNTKGLFGSDDDRNGNWYRLVRASGTSSPKGVAGGSFGIGKGAPIAASAVRTVFYSSVNEENEAVFQGKARLVSHYEDGDTKKGVGFYGIDGYKSIRDKSLIPPLFERKEQGTDIFIIGYLAGSDWQEKLVKSVLQNFWLAIYNGDLEVVVKESDCSEIKIDKESLAVKFSEYGADEDRAFFEAVANPTQTFTQELRHLGKVSFFVKKQEGYPRKIMMVRRPKMLVWAQPYRVLREDYSGVCICDDDKGNMLLRDLEPPAHDKWDKDRADNGPVAIRELESFIKLALKGMGESITSEPEDIPGLDKYLPESDDKDSVSEDGPARINPSEKISYGDESAREVGAEKEITEAGIETTISRVGVVQKTGSGKILKGSGKPNKSDSGDGPGSGGGDDGDGTGERINTSDIIFRSICQEEKNSLTYVIIITARRSCKGAIRIVAVGDDTNYPVLIDSASDFDSKNKFECSGSDIKGIQLEEGGRTRIMLKLKANKKYSLGIESYED